MEEIQDINYVFNDVSLYTKETFHILEDTAKGYVINQDELKRFLTYIGYNNNRLISFCHKCKNTFPFEIERKIYTLDLHGKFVESDDDIYFTEGKYAVQAGYLAGTIDLKYGKIIGYQPPYEKERILDGQISYIEYIFTCTNDFKHKYIMLLSIEIKNACFIVRKIGQNPSMLTVKGFDFDKYEKFLTQIDAYEDYKKADLSFADHFYAGAFTYLRRIFEKMVKYYIGDKQLPDNHMDTKIEAIKNNFDPRIQGLLKQLYEILSISIHELDEEQSKEYYEYLKAIIDMQLEFIKTEDEKEKQSGELRGVLSKITNLLNKK